ncbi:MAG TPA: aminotransferase class I/II-fold pyridoxal phosphate-dependent enzyme [Candidatus Acutalibacter stercoravium]|nr:aminotransferase class I/II-fold pyridoxal phosphate-dependent enzyme [Candidatus Acutalibacter stercoravium]
MNTPVADFVQRYAKAGTARLHMPGHKGRCFLGCEPWDITEIHGADALYEAEGILAESEQNAAALFGSQRTCYSTEGSSQCIRAMLYLAVAASASHTVVAARNVHRAFVSAAALLDLEIRWLWPEESRSLCGCPISPAQLEEALGSLPEPPAAVYLTSPDYLGGMAEIPALAQVCHQHGTLLLVDNAHGAYLRFLEPSLHPLDLGADLCCDSAHKTLPVLTGGAYLHLSPAAPARLAAMAKSALGLFGSTSPSYLTLASLDLCNRYLAEGYPQRLAETVGRLEGLREKLAAAGWQVESSDLLRVTVAAPSEVTGQKLARRLRRQGVECEYADRDFLVLMATPENTPEELARAVAALGQCPGEANLPQLPLARGERACSIRQAAFAPRETVDAAHSLGRICGLPTVGCPPAIPIAVSGERIAPEALALFEYYGISQVEVLVE